MYMNPDDKMTGVRIRNTEFRLARPALTASNKHFSILNTEGTRIKEKERKKRTKREVKKERERERERERGRERERERERERKIEKEVERGKERKRERKRERMRTSTTTVDWMDCIVLRERD